MCILYRESIIALRSFEPETVHRFTCWTAGVEGSLPSKPPQLTLHGAFQSIRGRVWRRAYVLPFRIARRSAASLPESPDNEGLYK